MYQFGADDSTMHGAWAEGTITEGKWVFKVNPIGKTPVGLGRAANIGRCSIVYIETSEQSPECVTNASYLMWWTSHCPLLWSTFNRNAHCIPKAVFFWEVRIRDAFCRIRLLRRGVHVLFPFSRMGRCTLVALKAAGQKGMELSHFRAVSPSKVATKPWLRRTQMRRSLQRFCGAASPSSPAEEQPKGSVMIASNSRNKLLQLTVSSE